MRVLIIASLIAITYSATVKNIAPTFTMGKERSCTGPLCVSVTFPDGYKDDLVLKKFHANEEDRIADKEHCNYIGHLANEPEACVAMTGCLGSEDIHFTILSGHAGKSSMFKWTMNGNVEVIESSFKNGALNGKRDMLVAPRDENIEEEGDEESIPANAEALFNAEANCVGNTCTLPATQHLQIGVGYDDGIMNQLGGVSQTEAYIASIWTHLQVNYCHLSLGSKVLVERLPGIKHYAGMNLKADGLSLTRMETNTENGIRNGADLMLYLGFDGAGDYGVRGVAFFAEVCNIGDDRYKQSISNYGSSHSAMGGTLAHEVGHNLGMAHDFASEHGGFWTPTATGGPCDSKGFMSYGIHLNQWSECSVKDFTAQYMRNKDHWCLPAAPSACEGITDAPTTCPVPSWLGDGYCDDATNNAECQYDGGDCCGKSNHYWNKYCKICKCHKTA